MTGSGARPPKGLAPGSAFWRRLAHAGARHGPDFWLRWSPPLFGLAFALALPEKRRRVRGNLRSVLGRRGAIEEQLDVARTFVSYASCFAEALGGARGDADRASRRLRGPGLAPLLASGSGLIVATAHFGAWDRAAALLARDFGRPVLVVMQPEADAAARELHDAVRAESGVRVVHVGGHPLDALPLLHHLRDGGIVAVQLDRVPEGGRAIRVPFFDRVLAVPEGPFALAGIARVPLVPLWVRRSGFLEYELNPGPALRLPERPSAEALRRAAEQAVRALERSVRACPTQWFDFGA